MLAYPIKFKRVALCCFGCVYLPSISLDFTKIIILLSYFYHAVIEYFY